MKLLEFGDIPLNVQRLCGALVDGLKDIFRDKLYGIYLYGAVVFPDSGPVTDIDCHVVLTDPLRAEKREGIVRLYKDLTEEHPPLSGELDIWYILLEDALKNNPPPNQLKSGMRDESWALHCAHIRAGRYITLYGPDPDDIFPTPSGEEITAALDHEIEYIRNNLKYPAYCVLNLCRIMYSYEERDVVVSKRFSGFWADDKFPEWSSVILAALRTYEGKDSPEDKNRLKAEMESFLEFAVKHIDVSRGASKTDAK